MSYVTSAVIVASYIPQEVKPLLTERRAWGREGDYEQGFGEIDTTHSGGGKVLQSDVYAAGFNHIDASRLGEWFLALPWGEWGAAVLIYDSEGDFRTVVCTKGWTRKDEY